MKDARSPLNRARDNILNHTADTYLQCTLFKEAIRSVQPCLPWFARVIISEDYATAAGLANEFSLTSFKHTNGKPLKINYWVQSDLGQ